MSDTGGEKLHLHGSGLQHLDEAATIEYRHEVVRKSIHLFSLSIPIIYFFISRPFALLLLLPITAGFIIVDLARYYFPPIGQWFYRWFGWLLRRHETDLNQKRLNGASNVLIAASISVLLFPKVIAITAISILIISDTTSALVGRRFGRHRFLAKSLEGSLGFFISAILVVLVTPKAGRLPIEYFIGALAAAIGTIVEALPIRIDDNISVPLSVGFSLWALYALLAPAIIFLQ